MFRINPKRRHSALRRLLCKPLLLLGFQNIDYYYIHGGGANRVSFGAGVSVLNATFNVASGSIEIGDNTIFGHNVHVVTGVHRFYNGRLAKLSTTEDVLREVPEDGYSIKIGSGCFVGTGAIILGNVEIGANVIIAAGAVVTSDIPNGAFVAGVPAKVIRFI